MSDLSAVDAFRGGDGLIRIVGHRGARGVLPENTMLGFEFALSIGLDLLEFDVVMTSDMVPVITHNHRLHAPTFRDVNGDFLTDEPKVASLPSAQIQSFDVGRIDGESAYGKRFPDQAQIDGLKVPCLRDLLTLLRLPDHQNTNLMLEIKSDPDFRNDTTYRKELVAKVVAEVRAAELEQRTLLHSFDWDLLKLCQSEAPTMPTSFLTQMPENKADVGEDSSQSVTPEFVGQRNRIPELVVENGGSLWCPYISDVTADGVAQAQSLGLCVAVWTVNEMNDIDRMIKLGVDAIVTDYPGRVQRRLLDRGIAWR